MQESSPLGHGFTRVARSIHFRRAPEASSSTCSDKTVCPQDPDLVVLFTWTCARPSHIIKYTTKYLQLHPSSAIMVITTSFNDLFVRSCAQQQHDLHPAVHTLVSQNNDANILIHCFSEGGSYKAVQFAKAYLKTTDARLPITALCLDSTPGTVQASQIPKTCAAVVPDNRALKAVASATGYVILASYLVHQKYLIAAASRALDDDRLWDTKVPRCYLYSEADRLVRYDGIIQHASQATKRGTPVSIVRFERSAHCAHIKEDPDKYWAAVLRTWNLRDEERSDVFDNSIVAKNNVTITISELSLELGKMAVT